MTVLRKLYPYGRNNTYTGRSGYRTVPSEGLKIQVRLRYGTVHTRILTLRDTAVAVYGTVDSPSHHCPWMIGPRIS
jgi:hypothetical protein